MTISLRITLLQSQNYFATNGRSVSQSKIWSWVLEGLMTRFWL